MAQTKAQRHNARIDKIFENAHRAMSQRYREEWINMLYGAWGSPELVNLVGVRWQLKTQFRA